jgi:DNA-binding Lrp family transcriptional regulator
MGEWTFFSNYGHVLVCLARDRDARLRDVAQEVGITERAVQKIVRDLQAAGYLEVSKKGRCNRYRINRRKSLRHPLQSHCTVGKLLALLTGEPASTAASPDQPAAEPTAVEVAAESAVEPEAESLAAEVAEPPAPQKQESTPGKDARSKPEERKSRKPASDTRQQGSLF